ncbi:Rossmann-like domain-containing protein [Actinokineospora sp. HUAS TT18]|uniref:Rossmann-like domain-containing protein n=1 Tax=Actinokineospora sp. HUAS TT18 TaxID=3447451 RepID=UPI003F5228ED
MTALATLIERVRAGELGPDPAGQRVSVGFVTQQGVRHASRGQSYRNEVVSLRVDRAVGSCAVEPGEVGDIHDCVGATIADLLHHPSRPIRVAALDAYLMSAHPHETSGAEAVRLAPGSSLEKSMARASAVIDLVDARPGQRVLVIGVVNSLLHHLRARGIAYVPCDLKGGRTEWDEPIATDAERALADCDIVLASGMTLGNGSLDPLLRSGKRVVLFAQTGSAVLPHLIGHGVDAVSAEPFPFFWLDGGPSTIHLYRGAS